MFSIRVEVTSNHNNNVDNEFLNTEGNNNKSAFSEMSSNLLCNLAKDDFHKKLTTARSLSCQI